MDNLPFPIFLITSAWNESSGCKFSFLRFNGESFVQAAIDRVMQTYGMLVNLTAEQEQAAREKVSNFLASAHTADENKLAVEGLRYLRAAPPSTVDKS